MPGGRGIDPETALHVSLDGTANRLADDNVPVLEAIAVLRELAGGRVDAIAAAAGSKIGGYLGTSMANPNQLKAAHLLVLASDGLEHDVLVAAADKARKNAGGSAYSL